METWVKLMKYYILLKNNAETAPGADSRRKGVDSLDLSVPR
jgi:hypothetical protein